MQNRLFRLTRWRLAGWYAGVMGLILSLCGFTVYKLMIDVRWVAIEREMESVAEALQESIEPALKQPGQLEPTAQQLLPGLCLASSSCSPQTAYEQRSIARAEHRILSIIYQGGYCVRLVARSGHPIAHSGFPSKELPPCLDQGFWRTFKDRGGNRYHLISRLLYTQNHLAWGYMQVARSLEDFDDYISSLRLILLLGLLMAIILISISSWWLAGLAIQPVHRSYQQMQQFTADAAHELRTPVAAIRATAQAALRMNELPKLEESAPLQTIERQSRQLSQLVQDLLLLCRIDQEALPVRQLPCCLNNLLSSVLEDFAALAMAADVMLAIDIRVNQLLYVSGNEEQIYRLISNLIINAIQYTPASGKVTVILDRGNQHALIQVQDTGIGIAPNEQTRIFTRFYRVQQDRSRRTGGTGLGLAIARAIAQAHQGSLQVASELDKGSTFTIRLPLGTAPSLSNSQNY